MLTHLQLYNTTFIRWTTHSPPGLSAKDIAMASYCDEQAVLFEEVMGDAGTAGNANGEGKGEKEDSDINPGRELADRAVVEAGDCCVPKGKRNTSV